MYELAHTLTATWRWLMRRAADFGGRREKGEGAK